MKQSLRVIYPFFTATARLRREYTELRYDDFQDDHRLIRERTKFAEQLKLLKALKLLAERDTNKTNNLTKRDNRDVNSPFRFTWKSEITKRYALRKHVRAIFSNF